MLALIAGLIAAAVAWPVFMGLLLGGIVMMQIVGRTTYNRYLRRLASQRIGEDIGTFACGFDRHSNSFDPWVVRATWDALEPYVVFRGGRVPVRPGDRLEEDLLIDPDDIEDNLEEVAARCGRSLDHTEANPLWGQVETVGDFVRFLEHQPRVATPADEFSAR